MQKIKLVQYSAEIKYLTSNTTQDINILLAPSYLIYPDFLSTIDKDNPTSHLVLWTEHTDSPEHRVAYGNMTDIVLKHTHDSGSIKKLSSLNNVPPDEFQNLLEEELDIIAKNNFNIPRYIAQCSDVDKKIATHNDTPEARSQIRKYLEERKPFFLVKPKSESNSPDVQVKALAFNSDGDLEEVNLGDKRIPPNVKKIIEMFSKDETLPKMEPTQEITKPEPVVMVDVKEKNKGKLLEMINNKKYKKEEIKALVDSMTLDKLKSVYPDDEVEQLITYLKK